MVDDEGNPVPCCRCGCKYARGQCYSCGQANSRGIKRRSGPLFESDPYDEMAELFLVCETLPKTRRGKIMRILEKMVEFKGMSFNRVMVRARIRRSHRERVSHTVR